MKKLIGLLIMLLLVFTCAVALGDVAINTTNFPDSAVRSWASNQDKDGSKGLSAGEIANVKSIYVFNVGNTKGLERFTSATSLTLTGSFTSLNVNPLTALTSLDIESSALTSLDVSRNTKLTMLSVISPKLAALNLTNHPYLSEAYLESEKMTGTNNSVRYTGLYEINGTYQSFRLQIGSNTKVTASNNLGVMIDSAHFEDAAVRAALAAKDKNSNGRLGLEELDFVLNLDLKDTAARSLKGIEYLKNLSSLYCDNTKITSIDLTKNPTVDFVIACNTPVTEVKLAANSKLRYLNCMHSKLAKLDVTKCADLEYLEVSYSSLSSLDVTHNAKLVSLGCGKNNLSKLDVTHNAKLAYLVCADNPLKQLDIRKCPKLVSLTKSVKPKSGYYADKNKASWLWQNGSDDVLCVNQSVEVLGAPAQKPTTAPQPANNTPTVNGLQYKISGSEATVTGAKDKNAKKVKIPATIKVNGKTYKVTSIKDNAFKGMKKLTSVEIGKNVKTIGKNAFAQCTKLKTITIKTTSLTKSSVKSNAFKGIYKKATVKCPSKKKKEYQKFLVKKGVPKTAKFK